MPPKPFNPPRPTSNAQLPGAKSRGRPKGSSKPKSAAATSKSKDKEKDRTSGFARPRVSNASTVLDIASGDEDEAEDDEEEDIEMGEGPDGAENDDDDDPFSSQPLPPTRKNKNSTPQQEDSASLISNRQTSIPPDLINVLLHGFFQHDNTRMSKDANAAVGRYIETFVREGLTRADYWKKHGWEEGGLNGNLEGGEVGGEDGAYLEVEDLERLAPQLILDF